MLIFIHSDCEIVKSGVGRVVKIATTNCAQCLEEADGSHTLVDDPAIECYTEVRVVCYQPTEVI